MTGAQRDAYYDRLRAGAYRQMAEPQPRANEGKAILACIFLGPIALALIMTPLVLVGLLLLVCIASYTLDAFFAPRRDVPQQPPVFVPVPRLLPRLPQAPFDPSESPTQEIPHPFRTRP